MTNLLLMKVVVLLTLLLSAGPDAQPHLTAAPAGGLRQTVRPNDSWLDRAPANWNRRMGRPPRPDASLDAEDVRTRCRGLVRQPRTAAERALVRAGWRLYGEVKSNGLNRVVTALAGADGMCRPIQYQAFVYWEGRYAGTLSPVAMDARTDGALTHVQLTSPTRIVADFVRYQDSDPLCCPSRVSRVIYSVRRDDLPLVAPVRINTKATEPDGGGGGEGGGGDAAHLFGRRWTLIEIEGSAVPSGRAYIEFDRGARRVAGDGGCNRFSGGFTLDRSHLRLSRIFSTRRACLDDELQRVETDFLSRLERVTGFRVEGDTLRLLAGGRTVLTFKVAGVGLYQR